MNLAREIFVFSEQPVVDSLQLVHFADVHSQTSATQQNAEAVWCSVLQCVAEKSASNKNFCNVLMYTLKRQPLSKM